MNIIYVKMDMLLLIIKVIVLIWDYITYPFYQAIYKSWKIPKKNEPRSRCLSKFTTDEQMIFEAPEKTKDIYLEFIKSQPKTLTDAWKWAVNKYGSKDLLGTREILKIEDEVQKNGKMFKKYHLGDYRWITYEDADATADYVGRGLRSLGLSKGMKICMFADTRAEWMLTAQASFRQGFPLVTLYTNLGEEAVVHGVNQTECTHVVTSHELLPKFRNILKDTPTITHIFYFEHQAETTNVEGFPEHVQIIPFYDLVHTGKKHFRSPEYDAVPPRDDEPAIIMYTSGSTGVPKGVILSHRNILGTLTSVFLSMDLENIRFGDETYLCFLPLAHVLELLVENTMLMYGAKLGYSSPMTMIDSSTMVKKGCKGDASVLKPTVMAAVPLILDRIHKTIREKVNQGGPKFRNFFEWAYNYRLEALQRGEQAPIMDFLIFRKMKAALGGKIKAVFTGGAPLSPECHNFIRVCLGSKVLQGYGLTETSACATLMELDDDTTVGLVGPPNQGMQIKLVNWEEGNYRVTDKPRPRGEIIIGGSSVADGYWKMEEKTKEDFYQEYGRTWFRSGDIGEMMEDGQLKIIDRKKDLVKLQFGEYISLGKVEAALKACPFVENICIYGDSFKSFCVALVSPDPKNLKELAKKYNKEGLSFEEMCEDKDVTGGALRELINYGKKLKLEKFEIPGAVTLVKDSWLPDSGLVTAAFKLKRKPIQQAYQIDIDRMYGINTTQKASEKDISNKV